MTVDRRKLFVRDQFPRLAETLLEAAIRAGKRDAFCPPTEDAVWIALDGFAELLATNYIRDQSIERQGAVPPREYEDRLRKVQVHLRSFLEIHPFSYLIDERRVLESLGLTDFRPRHWGDSANLLAEVGGTAPRAKASLVEALKVVDDLVEHARTAHRLNGQTADFRARGQALGRLATYVQALSDEFALTAEPRNDLAEYLWMRAALPNFAGKGETLREWLSKQLKSFRSREGITRPR